LEAGEDSCTDLVEHLAIDHAAVVRAVFPKLKCALPEAAFLEGLAARPLKDRLRAVAALLSPRQAETCKTHVSDLVRSWAAFAMEGELAPKARLSALKSLAADGHFGVREYAWMAYRSALVADFDAAFAPLVPWAGEADENLRRFASEATRPRGVWCTHLRVLRTDPSKGLPVLEPLSRDPSKYVRLSVGNWLNDASKDAPEFVREVTTRWRAAHPCKETEQIATRALRTLDR
jgi:3-methyladenine DNA glycosylase AlkC